MRRTSLALVALVWLLGMVAPARAADSDPKAIAQSVTIHRDVDLYVTLLTRGQSVRHVLRTGRGAWVQVARGSVSLNGERLDSGDGVSIDQPGDIGLEASNAAEVLLFDMAM